MQVNALDADMGGRPMHCGSLPTVICSAPEWFSGSGPASPGGRSLTDVFSVTKSVVARVLLDGDPWPGEPPVTR